MKMTADQTPEAVLKKHGKSFYWASLFMGRHRAHQAARLYAFCRTVDDLVDTNSNLLEAETVLQDWQDQIRTGKYRDPSVIDVINLANEVPFNTKYLELLIQGVKLDLKLVSIDNEAELIQYCYLVAGVVGLMMCSILGATDPEAKKFAIDLGIAMQLTNIIRDVAEDAYAGRQYIPSELLASKLDLKQLRFSDAGIIKKPLQRLFDLSQSYYQSGYSGLIFLPWPSRLSILIAARLYQEISLQARTADFEVLHRRIVVSNPRKIWLTVKCVLGFIVSTLVLRDKPTHDLRQHEQLASILSTYHLAKENDHA